MKGKGIIIGIAAVATITLGGGAFFLGMKLMSDDTVAEDSTPVNVIEYTVEVTEVLTTTSETMTETTTETEATTEKTTLSTTESTKQESSDTQAATVVQTEAVQQPVTDPPVQQQPVVADTPEIRALRAYAGTLRNFMNGSEYCNASRYDLYDITGDGVPELFISVSDQAELSAVNSYDDWFANPYKDGLVRIYTSSSNRVTELTASVVYDSYMGDERQSLIGYCGLIYYFPQTKMLNSQHHNFVDDSYFMCDEDAFYKMNNQGKYATC